MDDKFSYSCEADLVVALSEEPIAGGSFDSISNVCILLVFRLCSIPDVWRIRWSIAAVVLRRAVVEWEVEVQSCDGTVSDAYSNDSLMDLLCWVGGTRSSERFGLMV